MGGGAPALTVLVDARNVLRSKWPNIPEQELVDLCRSWAEAYDVRAVVAFDGEAPGGLIGEDELAPHCVLAGTGGESADDWLARAQPPSSGRRISLSGSSRRTGNCGRVRAKALRRSSAAAALPTSLRPAARPRKRAHGAAHGGADDDVPRYRSQRAP